MKTIFVILNYKTFSETITITNELLSNGLGDRRVVIVDNASPNDSFDILTNAFLNESKVEVYVEIHNDMQKDLDLFYSLYGQNFQMELVKDKKVIQSEQKSFPTIHYKISIPIPSSNWLLCNTFQMEVLLHF